MIVEEQNNGIEKGRPAFAFQQVRDYLQTASPSNRKEYRAHLRKFPTMVLTNGLGQTLAYYYSKNGADRAIYCHVEAWMKQISETFGGIGTSPLIESVLKMEQEQYRLATKQILNLVSWMSRFADGMLDKDGMLVDEMQGNEGK